MTNTQVKPYDHKRSKKEQIQEMFNNISEKYDKANNILSFGIHHYWRTRCIQILKPYSPAYLLDLATGTASMAIALSKLNPKKIIACDHAEKMLEVAQKKVAKKKLDHLIQIKQEDGEHLSFENDSFDAVTIAFGIRNFENYEQGLREMHRVLKPNGILLILEFTHPRNKVTKILYQTYFKFILPFVGGIITGDKKAYDYLPNSVEMFPQYEDFCQKICSLGFASCQYIPLTGGIASVYLAKK